MACTWGEKPALGQPVHAQISLFMIIRIGFKLNVDLDQTIPWFMLMNYITESRLYDTYFR